MMNNAQYNKFLAAVDDVCARCAECGEEACNACPVRHTCDRLANNQQAVASKCADCIPEAMSECENCTHCQK